MRLTHRFKSGLSDEQRSALSRAIGTLVSDAQYYARIGRPALSRPAAALTRELLAAFCRPATRDERMRDDALMRKIELQISAGGAE